jgi:glycosyltransferase involved in cell wall biosynthesis
MERTPMRIIHFLELFWPIVGGREMLVQRLIQSQQVRGNQCLVLAGDQNGELAPYEVHEGVEIRRFPMLEPLLSKDISALTATLEQVNQAMRSFGPDVVHLHDLGPVSFYCARSRSSRPRRLLVTVHGNPDAVAFSTPSLQRLLGMADRVAAVSEAARTGLRELMPRLGGGLSAIRNGCPAPPVAPLPLPFDPPRVLYLGRLSQEKRVDVAVAAFARLDRGLGAKLLIAGNGPTRQQLDRQVDLLGVRDRVEFRGMVPSTEIWHLLNEATMVVMPSRTEGLPLVALEASAMARPVLASAVGGLTEVVIDGLTGRSLPVGDVPALASAMAELLGCPERARSMGLAARRHVLEVFDWERFVDQYEDLYRAMIAEIP